MLVVVVFNLLLTGTLWQVDPKKFVWRYCLVRKYEDGKSTFLLVQKNMSNILKRCDRLLNLYLAHEMLCKGQVNFSFCSLLLAYIKNYCLQIKICYTFWRDVIDFRISTLHIECTTKGRQTAIIAAHLQLKHMVQLLLSILKLLSSLIDRHIILLQVINF